MSELRKAEPRQIVVHTIDAGTQPVLRLLLFSLSRLFPFHLTSPRRSSLLPEGGTHHFCSCITSDSYLHRSALSRRLRSSFYSSSPSCSFLFYTDTSLRLGQALLGPCTFFLFYINQRTSCIVSLTLTYLILSRIYQGHCSSSWISLSLHHAIESTLLRNLRTPASVLTLEPLKDDP